MRHAKSDAMVMIAYVRLQSNFSVFAPQSCKQHACVSLHLATQCLIGNGAGRFVNCISAVYAQEEKENRKRNHRWWVHDILKKRDERGTYQHLVRELQDDGEKFQQYFRLTREQFSQVLFLVEKDLVKYSGKGPSRDVI